MMMIISLFGQLGIPSLVSDRVDKYVLEITIL
jgi:hypothetical protein